MATEMQNIPSAITASLRTYQVVIAATREGGLGKDMKLPWNIPTDSKFFTDITTETSNPEKMNAVIMGRKSWESIPPEDRPLRGRLNVILTRSKEYNVGDSENTWVCGSLDSALELLAAPPYDSLIETVFNIGGGVLLRDTLNAPACDAIHITEMETSIECDTFVPPVDTSVFHPWYSSFPLVEDNIRYSFVTYVRVRRTTADDGTRHTSSKSVSGKLEVQDFSFLPKMIYDRHGEYMFLRLVRDIFSNGNPKNDSAGTSTLSKFGCQMRFNLRKTFPLLTTKRVVWQGVVEELLWCISGKTNAKVLEEKGTRTWDGNASRCYFDSIGLTEREKGELGPVCGFQWRHSEARCTGMHVDYSDQGVDQLLDAIDKIKSNPNERHIVLSILNPSDHKLMVLPLCHTFAQFYVVDGELSCLLYQKSADMCLGMPLSIASYALLTCVIAHVCDLHPGDFIHDIGDAHVDVNHIALLQEQLRNPLNPFPVLKINPQKKDIDSFVAEDFKLVGYESCRESEVNTTV